MSMYKSNKGHLISLQFEYGMVIELLPNQLKEISAVIELVCNEYYTNHHYHFLNRHTLLTTLQTHKTSKKRDKYRWQFQPINHE